MSLLQKEQGEKTIQKYNILNIRSDFKLAGPGVLILEYSKELRKRGHKVIVATGGGELARELYNNDIKHYQIDNLLVNKRSAIKNIKTIIEIRKILLDEDINIIHGHNAASTALAYLAARTVKKEIKIINTVHGIGKEWFLRMLPCELLTVSEDSKAILVSKGIKSEKIHVIYNGIISQDEYNVNRISPVKFRNEVGVSNQDILVGSVAMVTGGKGHKEIIESIPLILNEYPNVKFVFVGDGIKLDTYKDKVVNMGLSDNVIFTGKRRDIPNIMAGLDIFGHMPISETFGMVLIEAMAMGTPVVAKNVGGISEVVMDGKTGFLVSDIHEFANKIVELAKSREKRIMLGETGLNRVKEFFLIDSAIDELIKLYRYL